MHLIGCLLLDGRNAPGEKADADDDPGGTYFITDLALDYPRAFLAAHRTRAATESVERLSRYSKSSSSHVSIPELATWQPAALNLSAGIVAPFTERVAQIADHSAFQRLQSEPQLGWINEVAGWSSLLFPTSPSSASPSCQSAVRVSGTLPAVPRPRRVLGRSARARGTGSQVVKSQIP